MQKEVSIGDEVLAQGTHGLIPTKVTNVVNNFMQGKHCLKL